MTTPKTPTTPAQAAPFTGGDAWRYCDRLNDPEAVKALVQAALTAHATLHFARTQCNPEEFATAPDWAAVQRELAQALRAVGHPAGGSHAS